MFRSHTAQRKNKSCLSGHILRLGVRIGLGLKDTVLVELFVVIGCWSSVVALPWTSLLLLDKEEKETENYIGHDSQRSQDASVGEDDPSERQRQATRISRIP